jgi:NAD(P)-dependent dehydrogenase (short-subunit alcohol dehydrogenase family)
MSIAGQHVVVVGGGSGIGRALARAAAQAGARVTAVGRRREPLEETGVGVAVADVTVEAEVRALFASVGAFDHLVCTAAGGGAGKVRDLTTSAVERAFAAKLWAPLHLVRHGLPHIAANGSFTFFSGIRGARPTPGSSVTSLVNGGLEAFARAMAVELGPIRVNVVSPGIVDSGPFWERLGEAGREQLFGDYAARAPLGRVGTVDDAAAAALYAMTHSFVTGTVLSVDGGASL